MYGFLMNKIKNDYVYIIFYYHIDNEMFDLKYYALINSIKGYTGNINDYSKLRGVINNREDYFNLYDDFFFKNGIDAKTYSACRVYILLSDIYFSDYDTDVVDKKYAYYRKSIWNGRQNRGLISVVKS